MADLHAPSPEALAASVHLNNYLAMAALTMLYHDYALTLPREIEHFWKKARFSVVSTLFVFNRYLGLLGPIPVVLEYFVHWDPQRCRRLQRYHQYYAILSQVIVGLVLIMRTYALYNRSKRVLVGLLILGAILTTITVVAGNVKTTSVIANAASESSSTPFGCDLSLTADQSLRSAIGWMAMVCIDTTVFVLTLVKTLRLRHDMQHGLVLVLFRDGAIYYAILVVANVFNIVTFLGPRIDASHRGIGTTLTNALATTLISRICLNLRDPNLLQGNGQWIVRWTRSMKEPVFVSEDRAPRRARSSLREPPASPVAASAGDIMLVTRETESYMKDPESELSSADTGRLCVVYSNVY